MKTTLAVVAAAGLLVRPAVAHHAFSAEFDANKPVTLTGTVTKVEWTKKVELFPQTQTRFAGFYDWSITFLPNDKGETPDLLEMHISGNYRYSKAQ